MKTFPYGREASLRFDFIQGGQILTPHRTQRQVGGSELIRVNSALCQSKNRHMGGTSQGLGWLCQLYEGSRWGINPSGYVLACPDILTVQNKYIL